MTAEGHGKTGIVTAGHTKCSLCSDTVSLERYTGEAQPPFPKDWWVDVVHDHTGDTPQWRFLVYYRQPGGRYPLPAKDIRLVSKQQKQLAREQRQIEKASSPKGRS